MTKIGLDSKIHQPTLYRCTFPLVRACHIPELTELILRNASHVINTNMELILANFLPNEVLYIKLIQVYFCNSLRLCV